MYIPINYIYTYIQFNYNYLFIVIPCLLLNEMNFSHFKENKMKETLFQIKTAQWGVLWADMNPNRSEARIELCYLINQCVSIEATKVT